MTTSDRTAGGVKASGTFTLGNDLTVHRLGFGAMRITGAGVWGPPADHDEAIRVLRRAVELGVDLIDTADSYGPDVSEQLIAEALHPYPEHLVIATKGGFLRTGPGEWIAHGHPKYLRAQVERSLRNLRVERIDLWQLHRIDPDVPVEDSLGEIAELQHEGKVRHIGLSEVNADEVEQARKVVEVVSVQNRYNVADREHEAVLDHCTAAGLGFIPWFPLATGNLAAPGSPLAEIASTRAAAPAQVALAWLLARSPVMLPIPGTSSVAHLEENLAGGAIELTPDEIEALAAAAG